MTHEEIHAKVIEILVETFDIPKEQIKRETLLVEDLDIDSIDAIDLIVKLQQYGQCKIDPAAFKQVRTVGDVVDTIYTVLVKDGKVLECKE